MTSTIIKGPQTLKFESISIWSWRSYRYRLKLDCVCGPFIILPAEEDEEDNCSAEQILDTSSSGWSDAEGFLDDLGKSDFDEDSNINHIISQKIMMSSKIACIGGKQ